MTAMILRCSLALVCLFGVSAAADDLIVRTSYGSIQGYATTATDGTRVRVFKNVPFAAPPVGDLRWRLPESPRKWAGTRDGTKYSAACMSNSTRTSSYQEWVDEDCLYLNVFLHGECSIAHKCPIVVYWHGGGMNYDSATYFNDTALVETYASKGVMLVIPAFRLGFTGQFSVGDDSVPANLGVYDALQAVKFISKEAAAFGGDKDAITLMGHSFGGALSLVLAYSPLRKLQVPIHKLILMSPELTFAKREEGVKISAEMIKRAGCTSASKRLVLACMRKRSGADLLAIQRKMEEDGVPSMFGGILLGAPLLPFKSMPDMYKSPPNVTILAGATRGEMDFEEGDPRASLSKGNENGKYVGARNLAELDHLYYNLTTAGKNNQTHAPDSQSIYLTVYTAARSIMEKGHKAFVYSYEQPTHNVHTDDLSFLMGIHLYARDEHEEEIAKFYPSLFLNFTKFGEPSPLWKPLNLKDRYFSIQVNVTTGRWPEMRDSYEKETIDFWIRKAPGIDRMITLTRAGGAKMEWDKATGGFRDLSIDERAAGSAPSSGDSAPASGDSAPASGDSAPSTNADERTPVLLVYTSYFPSLLLLAGVFLLGIALGRYLLDDGAASREERVWILGPDGRAMHIDAGKAPAYAEQMF